MYALRPSDLLRPAPAAARGVPPVRPAGPRRAAVAVELAVVLPVLMFLFVVAVDYCRVFYFTQVADEAARAGALYAADPTTAAFSRYASAEEAARASAAPSVRDQLEVAVGSGTDASGAYTSVTVRYPFTTVTKYPGVPGQVDISRTAVVRVAPATPK